jgi:hypothetical protein
MIKTIEVQLYGHPGNSAIVRMPDRQNPGIVIQADTLRVLAKDARELFDRLQSGRDFRDAADEAEALDQRLEEIFAHLRSEVAAAGEQIKV